jgi:hypothetical protein
MTVIETKAVEVAVEQAESAPAIQVTTGPSGELSLLSLQPPGGRMVIKDAVMDLLVDDTSEYNDLELRLFNLEATAARVRTFLDDAKTMEETLRVNQELTRLEGEIEQIKGHLCVSACGR